MTENHYGNPEEKMDHASGAALKLQDKEKMRWLYFYLICSLAFIFIPSSKATIRII